LLASHVMLHDGCTTAVEAAMMGCPIVNFSPVDAPEHEFYVANLFGRRCRTHDEALGAVLEALHNPAPLGREAEPEAIPPKAHALFDNFRNDSFAKFVDVMREAEAKVPSSKSAVHRARLVADELREAAVERAKHTVRRTLFPRRYLTAMHGRQRFPGFNRETVKARLKRIRELTGNPIELTWHSPFLFELHSSRPA